MATSFFIKPKPGTSAKQFRDIFMVGVYTAQRISDYNNIKKEDITYIDIHQKKTGAKVSIPCKKELIAERAGHTSVEMLKRYI
ncbi:MAG: hypothetical protein IJ151_09055, partial [Bacteroidales bacterium]|nr:hypothetical protein [Bacteroidales bacterium]